MDWPSDSTTTTQPTRTVTSVYHGSTQQGVRNQPKNSKPEAVGAGSVFSDNEDAFNKAYGIGQKPKGARLEAFLLRRR
jgi:hypothetical protein